MTLVTLDEKFREDVADLLDLPELHASRLRVHHFDLTEYDHLMQVAQTAHRVSRLLRADARVSARAGLLHDLGAHWFNTVKPGSPSLPAWKEPHAVRPRHPRTHPASHPPRTREAWAVVAADFITTARECHFVYRRARAGAIERVSLKKAATHIRTRARLMRRPRRVAMLPTPSAS